MRVAESLIQHLDFESVRKTFLLLSVLSLVLIPVDGISILLKKTKPTKPVDVQSAASAKLEPQDAYLAAVERSSLFGGGASSRVSARL